jgi:hypothetical protein
MEGFPILSELAVIVIADQVFPVFEKIQVYSQAGCVA